MSEFSELLLNVWQEACRHIEIGEAVERMAPMLAKRLPVDLLLVRVIEPQRGCVDTVASGSCHSSAIPPSETRTTCTGEELHALVTWSALGQVFHGRSDEVRRELPAILPSGVEGDVLAGPLSGPEGRCGVVVLVAQGGRAFTGSHAAVMRTLLEPFAVALENDRRLQEMNRLREAAEADKRSLLTRLGRQDLSDTIVGADSGLRAVMDRVELVAPTDAPVLIFGETGSGKEVVARAIHTRSRRHSGPFHRVNCGAIPSELIDSELFGHERGSFTGAIAMRQGWFERADGGTLFLDEIGELPPAAQVRLLRILQDGSFERVGGQRQLKVDVRIVGATHRDLQAMVAAGQFRQDLWYRLAVFPVHLPPLRDRPQDIPALATHFALRASRRFGTPPLVPTSQDLTLLLAYPWPGNVRELATVMERAAILGNGKTLEVGKALGSSAILPAQPAGPAPKPAATGGESNGASAATADNASEPFLTLDAAMARHIEAALERTYGRIEGRYGAARLLGINPHTLRARMRKLKIDWTRYRLPAEEA